MSSLVGSATRQSLLSRGVKISRHTTRPAFAGRPTGNCQNTLCLFYPCVKETTTKLTATHSGIILTERSTNCVFLGLDLISKGAPCFTFGFSGLPFIDV